MAKRPTPKRRQSTTNGQVYILKIWIGGGVYYKIGTTNRTALRRLQEIGTELIGILGYWPKMKIVKDSYVRNNYKVEAEILQETIDKQPKTTLPEFSGHTELRVIGEAELLKVYAQCMAKDYPVESRQKIEM